MSAATEKFKVGDKVEMTNLAKKRFKGVSTGEVVGFYGEDNFYVVIKRSKPKKPESWHADFWFIPSV